jgi:hypothetical protein
MPNTKGKKTLSEAAADVLAASIAATRPKEMQFGGGTTLNPAGIATTKVDLGEPVQRSNQKFPTYTTGVPTATPPGATPPVSAAPMPTIPVQPQEHEGKGDNKDPTGPISYNINTYRDRIKNKPDSITPGKGNICPPWAHMGESMEDLTDEEFSVILEKWTEDHKKGNKFNFNFGDKKKKMSKGQFDKFKESFSLSDEDAKSLFEDEKIPTAEDKLAEIVKNAISEQKQDFSTDVTAMFEGQEVSEEFKLKASSIFEAAVKTQVDIISEKIQSESLTILDEAVQEISESMIDQIDQYVSYMVSEWIEENEVAIDKGLKSEIVEDFIAGLRNLFIENYIDIPEDKVDMVSELTDRVAELEKMFNATEKKNIEYKEALDNMQKDKIVESLCVGLAETQKAKIISLAENVSYDNDKSFTTKITALRESYFPGDKSTRQVTDHLNVDQLITEETKDEKTKLADPLMQSIYDSLSRTSKI